MCGATIPAAPASRARSARAGSALPTRTSVGTAYAAVIGQVLAQRHQVGGAVLAVDQHEVEARDGAHLHQLLGRHAQQYPEQPVAVGQPTLEAHPAPFRRKTYVC